MIYLYVNESNQVQQWKIGGSREEIEGFTIYEKPDDFIPLPGMYLVEDEILHLPYLEPMEDLRANTWNKMKIRRSIQELSPFTHNGYTYDSNKEQIMGAVQMADLAVRFGQPFSIDWTLKDNTNKTHTAAEMIAVGLALGQHVNNVYNRGRDLRAIIENPATTREELNNIQWEV